MSTVRYEVKHHCRPGSLHEWCAVYAFEQRKITTRSIATGMVCAHLVYMNVTEHKSYRSCERSIANQRVIGTYVGTKNHSREFARGFTHSLYKPPSSALRLPSPLPTPQRSLYLPLEGACLLLPRLPIRQLCSDEQARCTARFHFFMERLLQLF